MSCTGRSGRKDKAQSSCCRLSEDAPFLSFPMFMLMSVHVGCQHGCGSEKVSFEQGDAAFLDMTIDSFEWTNMPNGTDS